MELEICLKDLRFYAYHGVFEEEKKIGNEFRLSLSVFLPFNEGIEADDLTKTVSYADLYDIVNAEMHVSRNLLEKVVWSIACKIKKEYPIISRGRIEIVKVHPPIPGMIGSSLVALNF